MSEALRRNAEKRLAMLKNERTSWEQNWRELSDFIQPMRSRLLCDQQVNKGDRRNNKIINNEATEDAGALAAGMMSGLTSRSRPWFNLVVQSKEAMEFGPVKSWLFEATERVRDVLLRSNFYNCQHVSYLEMGVFGTGAIWIDEDPKNGIRCEVFTAGEYYVANGADGRCNAFYREFKLTAAQMAERFGKENLSPQAQNALKEARQDQWFDCVQMVEPNADYLPGAKVSRLLPYVSLVWEKSATPDKVLEHRGFHEFPVAVVRWDTLPGDCYGTGPGRRCLGDIKALQLYERSSARMAETGSNPAVQAPMSLQGKPSSTNHGHGGAVDRIRRPRDPVGLEPCGETAGPEPAARHRTAVFRDSRGNRLAGHGSQWLPSLASGGPDDAKADGPPGGRTRRCHHRPGEDGVADDPGRPRGQAVRFEHPGASGDGAVGASALAARLPGQWLQCHPDRRSAGHASQHIAAPAGACPGPVARPACRSSHSDRRGP